MIRIGTRSSKLALWQAHWVADQLTAHGHEVEIQHITTSGDVSTQSLSVVGGQGVFVKEIQKALLSEQIDVAVHSLKDLPTEIVSGLNLASVPPRKKTSDCLLSREHLPFEDLPSKARVGTGSARRAAQVKAWRSDIQVEDIRGNVDSRIRKLHDGDYDAIILALAGLERLKLTENISEVLTPPNFLAAVGQGALGLECRGIDDRTQTALADLEHPQSSAEAHAERQMLRSLKAGCLAPVAVASSIASSNLQLHGRILSLDGKTVIEADHSVAIDLGSQRSHYVEQAEELGNVVADQLLSKGAEKLLLRD